MSNAEVIAVARTFLPPRSVEQLSQIPRALILLLPSFLHTYPSSDPYIQTPHGLYFFFTRVVGPYGRLLNKAFPSRAINPSDILASTRECMVLHVGNFLKYLVLYSFRYVSRNLLTFRM